MNPSSSRSDVATNQPRIIQAVQSLTVEIQRTTRVNYFQKPQTQSIMDRTGQGNRSPYPKRQCERGSIQNNQGNMNESSGVGTSYVVWHQHRQQEESDLESPMVSPGNTRGRCTAPCSQNAVSQTQSEQPQSSCRGPCSKSQQPLAARDQQQQSFGPQQQQQQYRQQQNRQQQQQQPQQNYPLLHNDYSLDVFEPDFNSTKVSPGSSRAPCKGPCSQKKPVPKQEQPQKSCRGPCSPQQQQNRQSQQTYDTNGRSEPDFKTTMVAPDKSRSTCTGQCNNSKCVRSQPTQTSRNMESFGSPNQQQQPQQPQQQDPMMSPGGSRGTCTGQCNNSKCMRPQQTQSARNEESFGSPRQQQQPQQQSSYELLYNDDPNMRFEPEVRSTMISTENSRSPCKGQCTQYNRSQQQQQQEPMMSPGGSRGTCTGQCNNSKCMRPQQTQSARNEESYGSPIQQQQQSNNAFEPDFKSTTIGAGNSQKSCVAQCNRSMCSRYQQTQSPAQQAGSFDNRSITINGEVSEEASVPNSTASCCSLVQPRQGPSHKYDPRFHLVNDKSSVNQSSQMTQPATQSCREGSCPFNQGQGNMSMPQGHSTPYRGNTSPGAANMSMPVACSTPIQRNGPNNEGNNESLPYRYVDQSGDEADISVAYARNARHPQPVPYDKQMPSMDFSMTIHGSSSSEEDCSCRRPSTAEQALASRTKAVFLDAMVKDNCCGDVIEATLTGRENFNDYAYDIAFAGQLPEKLSLVDPITILEAIHLRIGLERDAIRNHFMSKENATERGSQDRGRNRSEDRSRDRSKDRSKNRSENQETDQQQVIRNEDIEEHFLPKVRTEVNRSICAYLKAENDYRGIQLDSEEADFNVNVNAFESNFFNDRIRMHVYSAITDPKT